MASYKMDEADAPRKRLLDCPEEILVLVAAALTGTPTSLLAFGAAALPRDDGSPFADGLLELLRVGCLEDKTNANT